MSWTPENVEIMKAMLLKGHSGGEIGHRLGMTRNAIIGKMHRLKLAAGRAPYNRGVKRPKSERRPNKFYKVKDHSNMGHFPAVPTFRREKHKLIEWNALDSAKNVSFAELNSSHCRWPMWGEGVAFFDRRYCGCAISKFPYCGQHHQASERQFSAEFPATSLTTSNSSAKSPKLMMR